MTEKSSVVSTRIPDSLLSKLPPKGPERAAFIRKALDSYLDHNTSRGPYTVFAGPHTQEYSQLSKDLVLNVELYALLLDSPIPKRAAALAGYLSELTEENLNMLNILDRLHALLSPEVSSAIRDEYRSRLNGRGPTPSPPF